VRILSGSVDNGSAGKALSAKQFDPIAFRRAFLANQDHVVRMRQHAEMDTPDTAVYHSPGTKGFSDSPKLAS
jgi:N-ethylmaleimide reductase